MLKTETVTNEIKLKRPIYIDLEGSDLVGKSTLLKTTFKVSEYSKILCFHDRGILTHFLYNEIFERYQSNQNIWTEQLYMFCRDNGIIILVASDDVLRERFFTRSDDIFKLDSILKVNKKYKEFYREVLFGFENVKLIHVDRKSPTQIFTEAEELYKQMLQKGMR